MAHERQPDLNCLNSNTRIRSRFKTSSEDRWPAAADCRFPQNAHSLPGMLRFFVNLRLALQPDPVF